MAEQWRINADSDCDQTLIETVSGVPVLMIRHDLDVCSVEEVHTAPLVVAQIVREHNELLTLTAAEQQKD